jgi:hypothetical protein
MLGLFAMRYSIPILFVAATLLVGCQSPSPVHTKMKAPADYRLVQTQMLDGEYPPKGGLAPIVYVFIPPDDGYPPMVFQKFDSWQMESWLSLRARGSVVHFRGSTLLELSPSPLEPNPSAAQWEAFKAFCQKHDITFINESAD